MIRSDSIAGLDLDTASSMPLYRQIHRRIADAVLAGHLVSGARLPSARSLAAQLSIARGTVETAYQMLAGEGYVVMRGAAGTVVDPALGGRSLQHHSVTAPGDPSPFRPGDRTTGGTVPLFQMGLPALDAFPQKVWSRLVAHETRLATSATFAYQPPAGLDVLRTQVARYLAVARGVACSPAQIFITSGYLGALGLITRCVLQPGDRVWVEDPGYHLSRDGLRLAGACPVGVPVDGEGFDIAHAMAKAPPARMAVVTPTHQFPLGMTLSLPRRMALLEWAAATGAWIVEDDYDSEFRYRGKPLPALKSLDRHDRVLFVGTFSKVLSPGLRVGYLVAPPQLVGYLAEVAALLQPPPAVLIQASIAAFLEQGHLARHIRRMRQLYGERRAALADGLREHAGALLDIGLRVGGMHLIARLPKGTDDVRFVTALNRLGMAPTPLSVCGVDAPAAPGLLIGFTNVSPGQVEPAARRFAAVLNDGHVPPVV